MMSHAITHSVGFYVKIWVALLTMLAISIVLGNTGHATLAIALIFGIAIVKAFLVAAFYMGLALEARYVAWILISGLIIIFILFLALLPDIVYNGQ